MRTLATQDTNGRTMPRFHKVLTALTQPCYWPTLARGVLPSLEHASAFIDLEYRTIIDVGANKGQFAAFALARWPQARVICFEPLPVPRTRLASVTGGAAEIHALALGITEGDAEMHIASREDSSSLLPLGEAQKSLFHMKEMQRLNVPVQRLDTVLAKEVLVGPILLKIDVQGFEYEVLEGARGLLNRIDAVYVECSFIELYTGQKLASDVSHLLESFGFAKADRFNGHVGADKALIQADFLFLNEARGNE